MVGGLAVISNPGDVLGRDVGYYRRSASGFHPLFPARHSDMRVGIIALLQESNTFLRERTTLAHFREDMLVEGEEVRQRLAGSHHETAGFFAGLEEAGLEAVPIFAARALPFGVVVAE